MGLGVPSKNLALASSSPSAPAWVPSPLSAPPVSRQSPNPTTLMQSSVSQFSVWCGSTVGSPRAPPPIPGVRWETVPAGWGLHHFTCHRTGPQQLSRNVEETADPIPSPSAFLKRGCLRVRSTVSVASKSPPQETDLPGLRLAQLGGGVGAGGFPTPEHIEAQGLERCGRERGGEPWSIRSAHNGL